MTHALKTWPEYYQQITSGAKPFEVRKNDRDYKTGDRVLLQEFEPDSGKYTGKEAEFRIGYILHGPAFGIKQGFCVFALDEIVG
jgi:ribosomal protein S17